LLSWYAIQNYRKALLASSYTVLGALVGGALLWWWGGVDADSARALFVEIPAINEALIAKVQSQLREFDLLSLFVGPIKGIPYRIYILEAANIGYGLVVLLLVSIPARLVRFLTVALVLGAFGQLLQLRYTLRAVQIAHITLWSLFYAWYFWVIAG